MFGDLDWPLNASRGLSTITEFVHEYNQRVWSEDVDSVTDCGIFRLYSKTYGWFCEVGLADITSCVGGRHTMPRPCKCWLCGCRHSAARSGRWHINCRRRDKLIGDLNSQTKRSGNLDLWPFDLESGVRVACDVGYLYANFSLPRPLRSRLIPDVCDRQTDVIRQTRIIA